MNGSDRHPACAASPCSSRSDSTGGDLLDGGGGFDIASYAALTTGIRVVLDRLAGDGEPGEGDAVNPEAVLGGSGPDLFDDAPRRVQHLQRRAPAREASAIERVADGDVPGDVGVQPPGAVAVGFGQRGVRLRVNRIVDEAR